MQAEIFTAASVRRPASSQFRGFKRRLNRGFTLVEILIVVIILGILAAIVIPQFSNASQISRANALMGQLKEMRSQIELFKLQHNDILPDLVTNQWVQLQSATNLSGAVDTTAAGKFGPYVNKAPTNPLNTFSAVAAAAGGGIGWVYDPTTGVLKATNQTPSLTFNESTGVVQ
jgi:general secretion pathway protein G